MMAAQLYETAKNEIPDLEKKIEKVRCVRFCCMVSVSESFLNANMQLKSNVSYPT